MPRNIIQLRLGAGTRCVSYGRVEETHGKVHGYITYLEQVMNLPQNIKDGNLTSFVIAAPDEFKQLAVFGSVEDAYKAYLNAKWKNWATRSDKRKIFVHWSGAMGGENAPDWVCKKLLMLRKQLLLK